MYDYSNYPDSTGLLDGDTPTIVNCGNTTKRHPYDGVIGNTLGAVSAGYDASSGVNPTLVAATYPGGSNAVRFVSGSVQYHEDSTIVAEVGNFWFKLPSTPTATETCLARAMNGSTDIGYLIGLSTGALRLLSSTGTTLFTTTSTVYGNGAGNWYRCAWRPIAGGQEIRFYGTNGVLVETALTGANASGLTVNKWRVGHAHATKHGGDVDIAEVWYTKDWIENDPITLVKSNMSPSAITGAWTMTKANASYGRLAYVCPNVASGSTAIMTWAGLQLATSAAWRMMVSMPSAVATSVTQNIFVAGNSSIQWDTAGKLRLNSNSTTRWTSTVTYTSLKDLRFELLMVCSTTVGSLQLIVYDGPYSMTVVEDSLLIPNINTGAGAVGGYQTGKIAATGTLGGSMVWGPTEMRIGSAALIGPFKPRESLGAISDNPIAA